MLKQKKSLVMIILLVIAFGSIIAFLLNNKPHIITEKSVVLYADDIIPLSQAMGNHSGFTCTGAVYDAHSDSFYIADAGKIKPEDKAFKAVIRQISFDFHSQLKVIACYSQFSKMQDIQGVTLDRNNYIWFCSHGENMIRGISETGLQIGAFSVKNPSGIAYFDSEDSFWILTNRFLMLCSKEGQVIRKYYFSVKGQDQLFLDDERNIIYITAGHDYYGDSYVYTFDIENELFELKYILRDSYAIEGLTIVGNKMYVFNDGLYHDAKTPINQVNIYTLH